MWILTILTRRDNGDDENGIKYLMIVNYY